MLQVGDFSIHLINDGTTIVDPGGPFGLVPRALWSRYMPHDENIQVQMTTICLLVQFGDQNIVVDTGRGRKITEKEQMHLQLQRPDGDLLDGLARLGVQPTDVNLVIDTHLHGDHCGGNTLKDSDGHIVPTFPNAEYVVQKREYEDATQTNERTAGTYFSENWDVLIANGQMRLLDGDTEIKPGIFGQIAPGHTPGHMAIRFESQGKHAAFLCDMASYAVHFERLAWMTAYDVEPLITLETKRKWQAWALETNALIIFPHEPQRPAGYLTTNERGKLHLQAVSVDFA